jgi:hypothetical protein
MFADNLCKFAYACFYEVKEGKKKQFFRTFLVNLKKKPFRY